MLSACAHRAQFAAWLGQPNHWQCFGRSLRVSGAGPHEGGATGSSWGARIGAGPQTEFEMLHAKTI